MTITVKLQEDGISGVIERTDSARWREGEPALIRVQGGQAELHFRGGRTLVSPPQFSSGDDGGRRATFEVQGSLKNEESGPPVEPPPDKAHS